jgi:hypothetical protein
VVIEGFKTFKSIFLGDPQTPGLMGHNGPFHLLMMGHRPSMSKFQGDLGCPEYMQLTKCFN